LIVRYEDVTTDGSNIESQLIDFRINELQLSCIKNVLIWLWYQLMAMYLIALSFG
jgi:hypothetical protein